MSTIADKIDSLANATWIGGNVDRNTSPVWHDHWIEVAKGYMQANPKDKAEIERILKENKFWHED